MYIVQVYLQLIQGIGTGSFTGARDAEMDDR